MTNIEIEGAFAMMRHCFNQTILCSSDSLAPGKTTGIAVPSCDLVGWCMIHNHTTQATLSRMKIVRD